MRVTLWAGAFAVVLGARLVAAQLSVDALAGTSFSVPSRLSIYQSGQPTLRFTAHYSTKPLDDTPYFVVRIGLWKNNTAWLLDLIHHKLYLDNPPPEVEYFRITYGFNIVSVGRAWRKGGLVYSAGLGAVFTHASSSVRGRPYLGTGGPFNKGYTVTGASVLGGAEYRIGLGEGSYLALDGKLSVAYVQVHVSRGEAHVPNAALHLSAGVGVQF